MKIVNFDRTKFALGLEWSILANDKKEQRSQMEKVKKSRPKSKAYVLKGTETGVAYTETDVPSAAALLCWLSSESSKKSGNPETWVVIDKVGTEHGQDLYWLCVASEGVVVPGMDTVGNYETISETLAEVVDLLDGATVYTTDANFEAYVSEIVSVNNTSFAELFKMAPKAALAAAKPKAFAYEKQLAAWIVAFMVAAGAASGGYVAYKNYLKKKRDEIIKNNRELIPAQMLKEAQDSARKKTAENFNAALKNEAAKQKIELSKALPVWLEASFNLERYVNGWNATDIKCTVEPAECKVSWARSKYATANDFLKAMPQAEIDRNNFSAAVTTFAVKYPEKAEKRLVYGPQKEDYELALASNMQSLIIKPFSHSLKPFAPVKYEASIVPEKDSKEKAGVIPTNIGVSSSDLELAGQKLWTAEAAVKEFDHPWAFAESYSLTFSPTETGSWKIGAKLWLADPNARADAAAKAKPANP